jgi:indole-3-glycerol phosphate synthase/phosphoribosylanthranilate isomerase
VARGTLLGETVYARRRQYNPNTILLNTAMIGITEAYTDIELKDVLTTFYSTTCCTASTSDDCQHIYGWNHTANSWNENHAFSMLQKITATVLSDYQVKIATSSSPTLQEIEQQGRSFMAQHGGTLNLQTVITSDIPNMTLAAEYKRASPSKGMIVSDEKHMDAAVQALLYTKGGANIISCLTESRYFHGTLQDLTNIRIVTQQHFQHHQLQKESGNNMIRRPAILRKDFITSKYMIAEAVAAGADTVLLIVAILPISILHELYRYCIDVYQIVPLVEIHTNEELDVALSVCTDATVIGINNRNLHTFQLDLNTSERIAQRLTELGRKFRPDDYMSTDLATSDKELPYISLCALSGMSTCYDVDRYRKVGITMCLIGESLMRSANPTTAIASLYLNPNDFHQHHRIKHIGTTTAESSVVSSSGNGSSSAASYIGGTQIIKICGITNVSDALIACQAGANLIGIIFVPASKRCVASSKQANDIVNTVRRFGERNDRIEALHSLGSNNIIDPIQHIVHCTMSIVQTANHRPLVVGVFQNQEKEYINDMIEQCGLDMIQLHGHEGMMASNPRQYYKNVPVIRVMDIEIDPRTGKASDNAVESILKTITNDPSMILLDTAIKNSSTGGGTGMAFDWNIARQVQANGIPVIVAGGLTPSNIALCIRDIQPFGVDVSSGVELEPATKDHDKLKMFITEAKNATVEANKGF